MPGIIGRSPGLLSQRRRQSAPVALPDAGCCLCGRARARSLGCGWSSLLRKRRTAPTGRCEFSQSMGATPITSAAIASGHSETCSRASRSRSVAFAGFVTFAVEDALVHPQQIAGAPDDAGCGKNSVQLLRLERAAQDQELADETVQQRQAHRRQHDDHEERRVHRHGRGQSAVLGDVVGVPPLVDHAQQHEQRAGGDAVVQHLVHRAVHARSA